MKCDACDKYKTCLKLVNDCAEGVEATMINLHHDCHSCGYSIDKQQEAFKKLEGTISSKFDKLMAELKALSFK